MAREQVEEARRLRPEDQRQILRCWNLGGLAGDLDGAVEPAELVDEADLQRIAARPDATFGDRRDSAARELSSGGDVVEEAAVDLVDPPPHQGRLALVERLEA